MRRLFLFGTIVLSLGAGPLAAQTLLQPANQPPSTAPPAASANAGAPEEAPVPGYLGIVADEQEQMAGGVRLEDVRRGTPAEAGGLKPNDIITAIDGKPITTLDDLDAVLGTATVGQKLRITVQRGGRSESMDVTLGTRPAQPQTVPTPNETPATQTPTRPSTTLPADPTTTPPADPTTSPPTDPTAPRTPPLTLDPPTPRLTPALPADPSPDAGRTAPSVVRPGDPRVPPADLPAGVVPLEAAPSEDASPGDVDGGGRASLGVTVVPLNEQTRALYGLTNVRRGAVISKINPDSPAAAAGLPVGGVLVRFETRQIDTPDDLVAAVQASRAGQEVEVTYYHGDRIRRIPVRLAAVGVASIPTLPPEATPLPAPRPAGSDVPRTAVETPPSPRIQSRLARPIDDLTQRPSSFYDPSEMAALRQRVLNLTEQVQALEQRLRLLEGRSEGGAPPTPPAPGAFGTEGAADAPPSATPPDIIP